MARDAPHALRTAFDETWPETWGTPGTYWRITWDNWPQEVRYVRQFATSAGRFWEEVNFWSRPDGTIERRFDGPNQLIVERHPLPETTHIEPLPEAEWILEQLTR